MVGRPVSDEVREQKRELRRRLGRARAALSPAERSSRSAAIHRHLEALPQLAARGVVAAFAATPFEVDLDPWLTALLGRGVTVVLPRVDGDSLALAAIDDIATLVAGWHGIREPGPDARTIALDAVEAVVTPGIAFDPQGHRLGHGGGHFDRLLAQRRPGTVVGVAFALQIVASVPREDHDVAVDVVVTEDGVVAP